MSRPVSLSLPAALALTAAVTFGTSARAQEAWELTCAIDGPKLVSLPVLADPTDTGAAAIAQRTYAYVVLTVENGGENPAPLAVAVRVQPMKEDVATGRAIAALLAQDAVLAAIRGAEANEELLDIYRANPVLEGGSSAKLVAILGRDVIPAGTEGKAQREFQFPASFDLAISGLKFEVGTNEGRVTAAPHLYVARGTYTDGAFSLGSAEFRAVEGAPAIDLGPVQESWSREQIQDFLQAWRLDLEVQRPRSVLVTEPPTSEADQRSARERTRAFWYVRLRVSNRTGAVRPLSLTARVFTRKSYDVDDQLLRELEDPALHPTRRRIYEEQIQQKELLPLRDPNAFRAAAAQEVERYGAVYGPIDFFSLPKTIAPLVDGEESMREMLRTGPTGAFDVIVLFSNDLDPGITEFEVRVGGIRNQLDWLDPATRKPEGDFHARELFRVIEEHASRFRRLGHDAILDDPFDLSSQRWVRLRDGEGLKGIDLVEPVKVGG